MTELSNMTGDGAGLAWQFEPSLYVDQEQIVVSPSRIVGDARLAGFGALTVTHYFGEQTQFDIGDASISGINPDGSATGTASGAISRAEMEQTSIESQLHVPTRCRWPTAAVRINRNELGSRVADRVHQGVPQEEAWAIEMDHSLRRGIWQLAVKKCVADFNEDRHTSLLTSFIASVSAFDVLISEGIFRLPFALMAMHVGAAVHDRSYLSQRRISIFPGGFQPDRLALAGLSLASHRLVKYRPPKNQHSSVD